MANRFLATAVAGVAIATASISSAAAGMVIQIDKSSQTVAVSVDGAETYSWAVSTGLGGGPPNGSYRPERMERKWASRKYGLAPMPHSIFFHKGYAIHGTVHVSRLGRRASHGCVRLHPANAAILFSLVQQQGIGNTRIVVGH